MESFEQQEPEVSSSAPASTTASEKYLDKEKIATSSDRSSIPAALDKPEAPGGEDVDSNKRQGSTAHVEAGAEEPVRKLKGIKWIICVLSIFSSVFLYALDNTVVATIQPAIINDFQHLEKLPWVSVAFQVTSVALDLTWGKLFAKFNGKTLFLAAVLIFEIGSAVCGAAPTIEAEIIGRAICGARLESKSWG